LHYESQEPATKTPMNTPANEWREEFDSEKLEEIINDVRTGLKDSVHIHNFIREILTTHTAHLVERLQKVIDQNDDGMWVGREFFDQAIDIVKDNK